MKMSDFAVNLPRTLISFRRLRKKPNLQERSQTEEDQELVISPPSTSAETVQIPATDTSPKKTMTALRSARPESNTDGITAQNMEGVLQEVVNPEGSVGSSGDTDVNVYCQARLRSLSWGCTRWWK